MPAKHSLLGIAICAAILIAACDAKALDGIKGQDRAAPDNQDRADSARPSEKSSIGKAEKAPGEPAPIKLSRPQTPSRSYFRDLIEKEATGTGLSPDIAESVMEVESGYNPGAVGSSGEIGLMQVMPSTARMMGFAEPMSALAEPETNIHYGVTYLARAWRLAGGDLCTAVMKYRAGHGETRFSSLSVDYCLAVRAKLRARGFPVVGNVPVAEFVSRGAVRSRSDPRSKLETVLCRRGCIGGSGGSRVDFADLNARLTAIVVEVKPNR